MIATDNDPRTTAELVIEMNRLFDDYMQWFQRELSPGQEVPMTKATEIIFGSSGRGGRLRNGEYPVDCKYFLVPEEEYDKRDNNGFVVDVARHKEVSKFC